MKLKYKVFLSLVIALLIVLIYTGWLDGHGRSYTEQGLKRTLVAYGIARGLNGVISVAQGTEVAIEPVGVGVTFTPGQILDPINDLIERFSWIVLASGVSLGVQNILLNITTWLWFSVIVIMLLLLSLLLLWYRDINIGITSKTFYKITLVLLLIRLTVPMLAIINEGLYQLFLAPQYQTSIQKLEQTTVSIEAINQYPIQEEDAGLFEKARKMVQTASGSLDIDEQLDKLKQSASEISEYTLNMIVVFVVQTLLFPLFFLWLAYKLMLRIFTLSG